MHRILALVLFLTACSTPEAHSLVDGKPLYPPPLTAEQKSDRLQKLADARAELDRSPKDADARIWLGRRQAYLGQYRNAIGTYSGGIDADSRNPRFYRHRGHRYITVRDFDRAIADLEAARVLIQAVPDEVEADGMPNAKNQPTSTLHFNIYYHLGLAYYLKADLEKALTAYRHCMQVSKNPDAICATSHWFYMTLRRLGRHREAEQVLVQIHDKMEVIENQSYFRLLLMYKGELPVAEMEKLAGIGNDTSSNAALAYGIANWHYYNGRRAKAKQQMQQILQAKMWAAFGYIAAEADLARWPQTAPALDKADKK